MDKKSLLASEGLAFFGRMDAAISHDLKNVMAVISETASLLDELTEMHASGEIELPPEKLQKLCGRINHQVERGQRIIRRMNTFAHSIDHPVKEVNLSDLADLMVRLSRHFASGHRLELEPSGEDGPVVSTHPFFLENLFHLGLKFALDSAGEDKQVTITVAGSDFGGEISFNGLDAPGDTFPTPEAAELAEALGAAINFTGDRLTLSVPATLPGEITI